MAAYPVVFQTPFDMFGARECAVWDAFGFCIEEDTEVYHVPSGRVHGVAYPHGLHRQKRTWLKSSLPDVGHIGVLGDVVTTRAVRHFIHLLRRGNLLRKLRRHVLTLCLCLRKAGFPTLMSATVCAFLHGDNIILWCRCPVWPTIWSPTPWYQLACPSA